MKRPKFSVLDMLNEKSNELRSYKPDAVVSEMISVHKLIPHENNFYDTTDILDLKDSIEMFGVKQNLIVIKVLGEDKYKVIAGHRRMLAVRALVAEGKQEFEYMPCRVEPETLGKIKEELLLIYTNSTTRQLSPHEKLEQFDRVQILIAEYKKTNSLPGRVRELVADALQIAPSQVGKLAQVSKHLIPEFKEELKESKISMSTAVILSGQDEERQKEALKEHKARGSKTKAKDIVVEKPTKQIEIECEHDIEINKAAKFIACANTAIFIAIGAAEDASPFIQKIFNREYDDETLRKIAVKLKENYEDEGGFADPDFYNYYFQKFSSFKAQFTDVIEAVLNG